MNKTNFYQPNLPSLIPFGFHFADNRYTYRELFMEGQFEAVVEVDEAAQLSSYVWDCEMEEVYTAHLVTAPAGAFVGQVREGYQSILAQVEEACCIALPFSNDQSNRIAQLIKEEWGDLPDYPFAKSPQTGAFRHPANNKWYALVTQVKRGQLDGSADQELVEIVNIKVYGREIAELLSQPGIYPAYHMSKKAWVSVLLDDIVEDEAIFDLLEKSRYLVEPKSYKTEQGPDYWIVPANPKYYDIDAEFRAQSEILWTQKAALKKGDWVYIYMTAPHRCLRYACQVLETNIANEGYRDQEDIKELMRLRLIDTFSDDVYPSSLLASHGVKAVRGPRRMTKSLIDLVEKASRSNA